MVTTSKIDAEGYEHEVIGSCTTNSTPNSQHTQTVEAKHLWSFAQEEALVALSEQGADKCWRLITDPERRARRIAARYADLYFKSVQKSKGQVQFYWPALAAFVVKDIVEAYRYSREEVLQGGWKNAIRTSTPSSAVSAIVTHSSPYEHAQRVYAALAKGNLWLFQDIYPWLWYFLEYGINNDGSLNADRMNAHVGERDAATLQRQSAEAVKSLPFGAAWLGKLKLRIAGDPVYEHGKAYFDTAPAWSSEDGGYGQQLFEAGQAHRYVKQHVKEYDSGYRFPPSRYWTRFVEAFYVMEEERKELSRVANDNAATGRLQMIAQFKVTPEIRQTYEVLIAEWRAKGSERYTQQQTELGIIAKQEQINILQPLIYEDPKLVQTMDINHFVSRFTVGSLSPPYQVVFCSGPKTDDPTLKAVFDEPKGAWDYATGRKASLPNPADRMKYVSEIADKFHNLMTTRRAYMDREISTIQGWIGA